MYGSGNEEQKRPLVDCHTFSIFSFAVLVITKKAISRKSTEAVPTAHWILLITQCRNAWIKSGRYRYEAKGRSEAGTLRFSSKRTLRSREQCEAGAAVPAVPVCRNILAFTASSSRLVAGVFPSSPTYGSYLVLSTR